jgi:hypothetical protein
MKPHIRKTSVSIRRLSPVEAEVWLSADVSDATATAEIRGRLVGPRCPGVTTIEVAYPLRPVTQPDASASLGARVIIPEPSLWTRERPFVYEGALELWQDGQCWDQVAVSVGLKSR